MLEKWKQKAVKMNLKRAVIIFIITAAALICVCSAAAYINQSCCGYNKNYYRPF